MWREAVEKIVKEQHEILLSRIAAVCRDAQADKATPTFDEKCTAIIAKGQRQNMQCNA